MKYIFLGTVLLFGSLNAMDFGGGYSGEETDHWNNGMWYPPQDPVVYDQYGNCFVPYYYEQQPCYSEQYYEEPVQPTSCNNTELDDFPAKTIGQDFINVGQQLQYAQNQFAVLLSLERIAQRIKDELENATDEESRDDLRGILFSHMQLSRFGRSVGKYLTNLPAAKAHLLGGRLGTIQTLLSPPESDPFNTGKFHIACAITSSFVTKEAKQLFKEIRNNNKKRCDRLKMTLQQQPGISVSPPSELEQSGLEQMDEDPATSFVESQISQEASHHKEEQMSSSNNECNSNTVVKMPPSQPEEPKKSLADKLERAHEILKANKNNMKAVELLRQIVKQEPQGESDEFVIMEAAFTLATMYDPNYAKKTVKKGSQKALNYYHLGAENGLRAEDNIGALLYQQGKFTAAQESYCQVQVPDRDTQAAALWCEAMSYFVREKDRDFQKARSLFAESEAMGGSRVFLRLQHFKAFDEAVDRYFESQRRSQTPEEAQSGLEQTSKEEIGFLATLGSLYLQEGKWKERGEQGWLICDVRDGKNEKNRKKKKHIHDKNCRRYPYDFIKLAADRGDLLANLYLGTRDDTGIPFSRRLSFLDLVSRRQSELDESYRLRLLHTMERDALRGHTVPTMTAIHYYIEQDKQESGFLATQIKKWEKKPPPFCIRLMEDVPLKETLEMITKSEQFLALVKTSWFAQALLSSCNMLLIANKHSEACQEAKITELELEVKKLEELQKRHSGLTPLLASAYNILGREHLNAQEKKNGETKKKDGEMFLQKAVKLGNEEAILAYANVLYHSGRGAEACKQATALANAGAERKLQAIAWLTFYYTSKKNIKEADYYRKLYDTTLEREHIAYSGAKELIDKVDEDLKNIKKFSVSRHVRKKQEGEITITTTNIPWTESQKRAVQKFRRAVNEKSAQRAATLLRSAVVEDELLSLFEVSQNQEELWGQFHVVLNSIKECQKTLSEEEVEEIESHLSQIYAGLSNNFTRVKNSLDSKISVGMELKKKLNTYEQVPDETKACLWKQQIYPLLVQIPDLVDVVTVYSLSEVKPSDEIFSVVKQ